MKSWRRRAREGSLAPWTVSAHVILFVDRRRDGWLVSPAYHQVVVLGKQKYVRTLVLCDVTQAERDRGWLACLSIMLMPWLALHV